MSRPDSETTVRALLVAASLEPDEDEIAAAVAGYPALRAQLDRLLDLALSREEEMQLTFRVEE